MSVRPVLSLLGALALAAACAGPAATPTPAPTAAPTPAPTPTQIAWPDELILGLVPSREADVLVENAKPLTDHLTQVLSQQAGKTVTVTGFVPQDYTGLVSAMKTGQADIGAFGPFSMLQAVDEAGALMILQSVRFGSATYHSQWFTNDPGTYCNDDPVADDKGWLGCNGTVGATTGPLAEDAVAKIAAGTKVAFVEQASTSGYIFPALMLKNAGIDPETGIAPIFAGSHDNSVLAVYNGDAPVGVSFDDARGNVDEEFPDVGQKVVVFAYSAEIPNDGWVVRSELPQDLQAAITQALLDYAASEDGKATLKSIYNIDGLQVANPAAFDVVREAADKLGL